MHNDRLSYIINKIKKINTSEFPNLDKLKSPLDMALWVLLVVKDSALTNGLTAENIARILLEAKERSISSRAITNAFNRCGNKVHIHILIGSECCYEIMKEGRDYLRQCESKGDIQLHYFEPGKPYKSKNVLREKVFPLLTGSLKIVEPYCSIRTLDVITTTNAQKIQLLTRLASLNNKNKQEEFVRCFNEFKTEHPEVEVRDWKESELHDRYILSDSSLAILGQSIKDLGAKESFAVIFSRKHFKGMFEDLISAFNRRWKVATIV